MQTIGLRYLNIFDRRQDPNGAYAAVIPKWFSAMFSRESIQIKGDGETSRDFCNIDNCVQANLKAATESRGGESGLQRGLWPAHHTERALHPHPRERAGPAP